MTEDFKPVQLPQYWKYTESWCDQNFGKPYEDNPKVKINNLCKSSSAHFSLTYVLFGAGEQIFDNIKSFNIRLSKVFQKGLDNLPANQITGLLIQLAGNNYRLDEDTADNIETTIETYNYHLAPGLLQEALLEVADMARRGCESYRYYAKFLTDLKEAKDAESRAAVIAANRAIDKGRAIEMAHVQVKEGLIYILTNELMPGILKIGFTSRNPDSRAREISSQIGLPSNFVVAGYWRTKDPYIVEQRVHALLSEHRKPREFFEVSLEIATAAIEKLVIS